MAVTLRVRDETATGKPIGDGIDLEVPDQLTLRDLIRHRVREEVARYNLRRSSTFHGLVQPTDAEATLNGYRMRAPRTLHWERQADIAIRGFETSAFVVLVGDRQVEDLDEQLTTGALDEVAFVRLTPLVGG